MDGELVGIDRLSPTLSDLNKSLKTFILTFISFVHKSITPFHEHFENRKSFGDEKSWKAKE